MLLFFSIKQKKRIGEILHTHTHKKKKEEELEFLKLSNSSPKILQLHYLLIIQNSS